MGVISPIGLKRSHLLVEPYCRPQRYWAHHRAPPWSSAAFRGRSRGYTIESDVHHDQIRAWAFSETDRVFAGADNIN